MLSKYNTHIIKGLNDKIGKLENIIKPTYNKKQGIIYIIKASTEEDIFKIGKTKYWKKRFNNYNTGKYENVKLVYVYETDDINKLEQCLKVGIKNYLHKKGTEIFKIELNTIKEVIK